MELYEKLICPLCRTPLHREENALVCNNAERRHCYDLARSGYVNLLPPGKEKNSHTGDDRGMIAARTRFLDKGHYFAISKRVAELTASSVTDDNNRLTVIDCGCGEGYHTCNILKTLSGASIDADMIAFDASKHGCDRGSKRAFSGGYSPKNTDGCRAVFSVGNIFAMPVKDGIADAVISMFAPIPGAEASRCLNKGGILAVISAGERHLFELRELLYDTPRESGGNVEVPEGFIEDGFERLTYSFTVTGSDELWDLFTMTPFYYRTSFADSKKLRSVDVLTATADVKITLFRKK